MILNDPVTTLFGAARLWMFGLIPIAGSIAVSLYGSIIYGNSLIQSRLSMTLEKRREYITNHIFSVFGYGAAFLFITQCAYWGVHHLTGRDGFLVYDALFTFLY